MALNIRVYSVVMRIIINRGALIIIRKAWLLPIWVLLNMGGNRRGGMGVSDGARDLMCEQSLLY